LATSVVLLPALLAGEYALGSGSGVDVYMLPPLGGAGYALCSLMGGEVLLDQLGSLGVVMAPPNGLDAGKPVSYPPSER